MKEAKLLIAFPATLHELYNLQMAFNHVNVYLVYFYIIIYLALPITV